MSPNIDASQIDATLCEQAIIILSKCLEHRNKQSSNPYEDILNEFETIDSQEYTTKSLISNFIALSLLRKPTDTAAVSFSISPKSIVTYYTKPKIYKLDRTHARALFELFARQVAGSCTPSSGLDFFIPLIREGWKGQFIINYFEIMLRNAPHEMLSRFLALRNLTMKDRKGGMKSLLKRYIQECESLPFKNHNETAADGYILDIAEEDENNLSNLKLSFIFVVKEFKNILERTKWEALKPCDLYTISSFAWAIGYSSIARKVQNKSLIVEVLTLCRKVGIYYQGASAIYFALRNTKCGLPFELMEVHIDSKNVIPSRYNNWYDVLKTIYFHHTKGKEIPISRVQWLKKYPEFETYNPVIEDNFTNHCEMGLITCLLQQGKWPTAIGVSKPSCARCHLWISHLNSMGHSSSWTLTGVHPDHIFLREAAKNMLPKGLSLKGKILLRRATKKVTPVSWSLFGRLTDLIDELAKERIWRQAKMDRMCRFLG